MGIYLNPTNLLFSEAVHKEIYVDKSLLIQKVEYLRNKENKYICVSRPRRFGKSTDANMLVAYYSYGCDSHDLFDSLALWNNMVTFHPNLYLFLQHIISLFFRYHINKNFFLRLNSIYSPRFSYLDYVIS